MHQQWPIEYLAVARLLGRAAMFADALNRSRWDFAVEICELIGLGLSRSDLRWLVCQELIEHAAELTKSPADARSFQPNSKLIFNDQTCFVLTAAGHSAVSRLIEDRSLYGVPVQRAAVSGLTPNGHHQPAGMTGSALKPVWNCGLNRLFLGDLVVKQFRRP